MAGDGFVGPGKVVVAAEGDASGDGECPETTGPGEETGPGQKKRGPLDGGGHGLGEE